MGLWKYLFLSDILQTEDVLCPKTKYMVWVGIFHLTPHSTTFQLYRGGLHFM